MKIIKKIMNKENVMHTVFFVSACISIAAVLLICIFLFANGIPAIKKIGFFDYIFIIQTQQL